MANNTEDNTSADELEKALDQLSGLNSRIGSEHCTICGINPTKLKNFITSYTKQREIQALYDMHEYLTQFPDVDYPTEMYERIKELAKEQTNGE